MTDPVRQLSWDIYADAVRRWYLDGCRTRKPRVALQIGSHTETLPVEVNARGENLPALAGDVA